MPLGFPEAEKFSSFVSAQDGRVKVSGQLFLKTAHADFGSWPQLTFDAQGWEQARRPLGQSQPEEGTGFGTGNGILRPT